MASGDRRGPRLAGGVVELRMMPLACDQAGRCGSADRIGQGHPRASRTYPAHSGQHRGIEAVQFREVVLPIKASQM